MKKRRYLGTSHLFNIDSNNEFVNGIDMRISDDGIETAISTPIEPERQRVVKVGPEEGRAIRKVLTAMEQEDMRARRQAGEFAFFKNKKDQRPAEPALVCEVCGGRGGNEDEDGNWVECSDCAR